MLPKVGDKVKFKSEDVVLSDFQGLTGTISSIRGHEIYYILIDQEKYNNGMNVVANHKLGGIGVSATQNLFDVISTLSEPKQNSNMMCCGLEMELISLAWKCSKCWKVL